MDLNKFKNYVDEYKSLPVSEELKAKTLKAAADLIPEDVTDKTYAKKITRIPFKRIAACFLFLVVAGSTIYIGGKLFSPKFSSADSAGNLTANTAENFTVGNGANNDLTNADGYQTYDSTAIAENYTAKSTTGIAAGNSENAANKFSENPFITTAEQGVSTFSIDIDTASYINFRRYIANMTLKQFQESGYSIRTEEAINYFQYAYEKPTGDCPVAVSTSVGDCSWNSNAKLAVITMAGKELTDAERKGSNIVFLIDISGSMDSNEKLPLLKESLKKAIENLSENDTVSIVTYASGVNTVLTGTKGSDTQKITNAIDTLQSGGGTAGSSGLETAYNVAQDYFIKDGNNRIILATDGDFNVGPSSVEELERMVTQKRESGIFLTIIGFGVSYSSGDLRLETMADKGNGGYYVIDCLEEGEKVLNEQFTGTLYTVAKDVKLQVAFNTDSVESYRLIGYENRMLSNSDFENDSVDAGDLGAGQTVTAVYEIILKEDAGNGLFNVDVRYKKPNSDVSELYEHTANISEKLSGDYYFVSAVTEACLAINDSQYKGSATLEHAYEIAKEYGSTSSDKYRLGFIEILRKLINK